MSDLNKPFKSGRYRACHCKLVSRTWWRVYADDIHDGLSDHPTLDDAKSAIKRYQMADKRRLRRP